MNPSAVESTAQSATTQHRIQRDAIIFIPGLSREVTDQTIEGVTLRLVTAMDRNSTVAKTKFRLGEIRDEAYEHGSRTRVCTIFKQDGDSDVPVVDVYGLFYRENFTQRYDDMSLLIKILLVALTIVVMSFRIVRSFGNPAKTLKEKVQIILSIVVLATLVAYVGLLFYAAYNAMVDALIASNLVKADPFGAMAGQVGSLFDRWTQTIVIAVTALGIILPNRLQLREFITNSAATYTALVMYLNSGERRNVLIGQLRDLIDHIQSKDIAYAQLHIVGYSFGSILLLDALFPPANKPGVRFSGIDSITTIGSPFDFVRAFWPNYFDKRQSLPDSPRRWFNIFSPDDVLSSNFRNDGKIDSAEVAINATTTGSQPKTSTNDQATTMSHSMKTPTNLLFMRRMNQEELTWLDVITFMGLRSHTMYWEKEDEPQINCFDQLVVHVYEGHALLQ